MAGGVAAGGVVPVGEVVFVGGAVFVGGVVFVVEVVPVVEVVFVVEDFVPGACVLAIEAGGSDVALVVIWAARADACRAL